MSDLVQNEFMIERVRNPASVVTPVRDDGSYSEAILQVTSPAPIVGFIASSRRSVVFVSPTISKRRRPRPSKVERFRYGQRYVRAADQGGQVIRPSVLAKMAELRDHVDKQFPA